MLGACDSPQNHRVFLNEDTNEKTGDVTQTFTQYSLSYKAQWLQGPFGSLSKKSQIMVILFNKEGHRTSLPKGVDLQFYATMPSMGHPLDDPGFFEEIETGIFINNNVQFNMPGEWKMELWLTDKDYNILDNSLWLEYLFYFFKPRCLCQ